MAVSDYGGYTIRIAYFNYDPTAFVGLLLKIC